MITDAYAAHLRKEHDGSKWGSTGARFAGELFAQRIACRPYLKTVLDFGCGKGTMKPFLLERFPNLTISEYDPGIAGKDKLPKGQFDLVMSSDVMEHIEPHLLEETIGILDGLTGLVSMHDIACSPTFKLFGEGPYKGQDLHLIIEEPEWWRVQFALYSSLTEAEYQHREKASNKGPRPRCLLVHERVG